MKKLLLTLIFFLPFMFPHTSFAACGSGYSFCQTMTVNHIKVPSTQTNFTVFATTTQAVLKTTGNGGHVQNTTTFNGQTVPADLVFSTAADCSALMSWDIEDYVASTGELEAWILNSSLSSASDTVFYMCYGKSSVSTYQGGAVGAAWDSNYKAVYHVANGSSLSVLDSTNDANGSNTGSTAIIGQLDGGVNYGATLPQYVTASTTKILASLVNSSVSMWVKNSLTVASTTANDFTLYSERAASGNDIWKFDVDSGKAVPGNIGKLEFTHRDDSGTLDFLAAQTTVTVNDNTWHFVELTKSGSSIVIYVDGVSRGSASLSGNNTMTDSISDFFALDKLGDPNFTQYVGAMDEMRLSNTNRVQNWVTTEYNNQVNDATFLTIGSEQFLTVSRFTFMGGLMSLMGGSLIIQ